MKKSSKKPVAVLLCAAAAVLVGLVAYDGVKQSFEFSSSSAMMNTAVSADIEGKDAKMAGKEVFACISELENKLLSRHIGTSAVSEINDAAGQSVRVTLFSSSAARLTLCSAGSATSGASARKTRECPKKPK